VAADDGTFWMDFEDMKSYFTRVQVGKVVSDFHYSFVKVTHPECPYSLIDFSVPESGAHTISVSQKGERMFPRESNYKYSNSRGIIVKIDEDQVTYIKGFKGFRDRDTHVEFEYLEAGDYQVFIEVDWEETTEERTFCLTSYGYSEVVFGECCSDTPREEILARFFRA
jgi:hypothetical protein